MALVAAEYLVGSFNLADLVKTRFEQPSFERLLSGLEPRPSVVHYDHRGVTFVPPSVFYWEAAKKRASDSVWMVPGSAC